MKAARSKPRRKPRITKPGRTRCVPLCRRVCAWCASGPAVMKMGKIEAADYQITVPASMAAALDAYNAADTAQVEKKTKSGKKMLELKE